MRHTFLGAAFALCVSVVFNLGCDSGGPPAANSFTKVYAETIQPKCSNDYCHYNGANMRYSALDLSSKVHAYSSLVGLPTMASQCFERGMRVVPGHPETSIMYLNLQDPPLCGIRMPGDTAFRTNGISELTPGSALSDDEQRRMFEWIREGAQSN
jgi:hypothetical protein